MSLALKSPSVVAARRSRGLNSYRNGVLSILPAFLAMLFLLLLPGVYTVWLSIYHNGFTFSGYRALFVDGSFIQSTRLSILYALVTVGIQLVLGISCAAIVHRMRRGIGPISIILFLPYAIPSVVAVISWRFLVEEQGLLAVVGEECLGIPASAWMGDRIFWTLILVSVWQFFPFVFVTLLARMRRIPPLLYRSAELDGAGAWQQFCHITLPQIRSTVFAVIALRLAFMFTKFDTPWLLGARTANEGLTTLPIYIHEHRYGLEVAGTPGIAAAVVMAIGLAMSISIVLTLRKIVERVLVTKTDTSDTKLEVPTPERRNRFRPFETMKRSRRKGILLKLFTVAFLASVMAFCLLPYVGLLLGSLLPNARVDRGIASVSHLTLKNYVDVSSVDYVHYWRYFKNTIFISTSTTITIWFLSILGAFGLTRYRLPGRKLFEQSVLWGYLFPPIVLVFPYVVLLQYFGLNNTLKGLILANVAFCFPFGLWLMTRYLEAVPQVFDHTAAIDGARWWQALYHVISHRALPGIVAVGLFSFILSWNDVALSLFLIFDDSKKPLALGVKESILDTDQSRYGTFAAASVGVATLAVLLFGFIQVWIDGRLRRESENEQ
jgi:multiple sugar transport system permease protein